MLDRDPPDHTRLRRLVAPAFSERRIEAHRPLVEAAAGFETRVNLIGNAVTALLDHPDQWAAVRDEPGLAGAAIEETLR